MFFRKFKKIANFALNSILDFVFQIITLVLANQK
jgi:hypothetical protein